MSDDVGPSRYVPINSLDFASMTTDPAWDDFSKDLGRAFIETKDKDGNVQMVVDVAVLKRTLSYYTRDLRLGNLSMWNGEYDYCRKRLDIASDILRFDPIITEGKLNTFFTLLSRVISVTELSQSKNGFFRRRPNTLTTEGGDPREKESSKRGFIGGGKKSGEVRYV